MCHRTGQFHVAARAHGALGATKALLGESHGAIQEWHAAAGLYRKQGNRAGLALAFEQIGVNYTMLNCLKVRRGCRARLQCCRCVFVRAATW